MKEDYHGRLFVPRKGVFDPSDLLDLNYMAELIIALLILYFLIKKENNKKR